MIAAVKIGYVTILVNAEGTVDGTDYQLLTRFLQLLGRSPVVDAIYNMEKSCMDYTIKPNLLMPTELTMIHATQIIDPRVKLEAEKPEATEETPDGQNDES